MANIVVHVVVNVVIINLRFPNVFLYNIFHIHLCLCFCVCACLCIFKLYAFNYSGPEALLAHQSLQV